MGTKSAASIISLKKSLRNGFDFFFSFIKKLKHRRNHVGSGLNLAKEKEKQEEVESVNSYESFMKKHLSHFGYYSSTSKSSSEWLLLLC